jgi:hypothetical protein
VSVYPVNAAVDGASIIVEMADTATIALTKMRLASAHYTRVWVTDEEGADVCRPELLLRIEREQASESRP